SPALKHFFGLNPQKMVRSRRNRRNTQKGVCRLIFLVSADNENLSRAQTKVFLRISAISA
ncbi:MAG: hypothetical protein II801_07735, partial [Bacteroidaceae bacterium]|nr:hypothetical protein [Bacteroidaceae bacterium]